jgi:hypothetical protein
MTHFPTLSVYPVTQLRVVGLQRIGNNYKERRRPIIELLVQHLFGQTKENH